MRTKNSKYIICPCCGTEYHISEIFFPSDLVSNPVELIKDEDGKIEYCIENEECLTQEYTCDKCDHKFKVTAEITFKTELIKDEDDFDEESSFKIYEDRATLEEPK